MSGAKTGGSRLPLGSCIRAGGSTVSSIAGGAIPVVGCSEGPVSVVSVPMLEGTDAVSLPGKTLDPISVETSAFVEMLVTTSVTMSTSVAVSVPDCIPVISLPSMSAAEGLSNPVMMAFPPGALETGIAVTPGAVSSAKGSTPNCIPTVEASIVFVIIASVVTETKGALVFL